MAGPVVSPGAVAIGGGRVVAVGHPAELDAAGLAGVPETDLGPVLLAPGLVDAHCHLEWSLMGGLAPTTDGFGVWLRSFLAHVPRLPEGYHLAAARLGALRAMQAGTTTLADNGPTGAGARALTEAGLRGVVHLEAFGSDPAAGPAAALRVAELADAAGPRVAVGVSPHAPYSAGPELWRALGACPPFPSWSTHIAESGDEDTVLAGGSGPIADALAVLGAVPAVWPGVTGASVVRRMADAGVLRDGLIAAHCVRLGDGDADVLASTGVRVAHCPTSNARLRCGRSPLEVLRAAGVVVGLGTDSPASAGTFDLRAEARACADVHGAAGAPVPSPAELVRLITVDGARVLGMEGEVGVVAPGARADLVAVRPSPEARPGDPHAAFLHDRSAVAGVWVDGEELLTDGICARVDRVRVETAAAEARGALC